MEWSGRQGNVKLGELYRRESGAVVRAIIGAEKEGNSSGAKGGRKVD